MKSFPEWKVCEISKVIKYEKQGCLVHPTGRGSDFIAICPTDITIVEVKQGCGPLTKLQTKTRREVIDSGLRYEIERCDCSKR